MVSLPLRVADARQIVGHPEWHKQRVRVLQCRDAKADHYDDVQRKYRDRSRGKMRENSRAYYERHPGARQAEKAARKAGAIVDPVARDYVSMLTCDPCSYCGAPMLDVDHIVPVALGGDGGWENLTAACGRCNRQKHTKPLLTFLLSRAGA